MPAGRLTTFLALVEAFDRDEIETGVDLLIAALDARDGDPDIELNGDEADDDGDGRDVAYPEWDQRARRRKVTAGGSEMPGMTTATEDDEDGGDTADGNGSEDDFMRHWGEGPGCPIADPGGLDAGLPEDDIRPITDPALIRVHRDRIRATRCDRIVTPWSYQGMRVIEWRLKA